MVLRQAQDKLKRLVLIDGHAIIHRAYHALPPLTTPGGQTVNAVYGFTTMLLKAIEDLKPTHLAVAFDSREPNFRQEMYIAYQAQRPAADQELHDQVALVRELVAAAGIPILQRVGYEADDLIGTVAGSAKRAFPQRKTDEVIIVTGDRDMLQLVNDKIKVYAPIKGLSEARLFDKKEVKEYLGVTPEQIVDYKALTGDASDNYPGVPGVGPKTAVALLEQFGTLRGIYKKVTTLSPSLAQKLREGEESALLSQKLAKIVTNAPVEFDLDEAEFKGLAGNARFIDKLRELGFRSLVARLTGNLRRGNGQMGLL